MAVMSVLSFGLVYQKSKWPDPIPRGRKPTTPRPVLKPEDAVKQELPNYDKLLDDLGQRVYAAERLAELMIRENARLLTGHNGV